ncbi:MAG: glycoside hydrolase family 25 protein [Pseudomonadota bacterium]
MAGRKQKSRKRADPRKAKRLPPGRRWLLYTVATIALVAIVYAAWLWWDMRSWRPDEAAYPEQGAVIASGARQVRFETLKALGAQFTYLELGSAAADPDTRFASRLSAAQRAGLKVGMLHLFDPCLRADPQSARFTRMVPRNGDYLPPAIALSITAEACANAVSDAAVESELMTLINQIELHAGKPVVLKVSLAFEEQHGIARTIERDLWLERDRAKPSYAGRPWLLWSANSQLVSEAAGEPIEWVVVQR